MKKIYILVLILLCSLHAMAANFYWVGGNGNWSDFQHHWAISSGGNIFQTTVPSAFDNVFFDNNSFPRSSDSIVQLDVPAVYANNINYTTNSKKTRIVFGSNATMYIYGSAFFSAKLSWTSLNPNLVSQIYFRSSSPGNTITLNKFGIFIDLIFDGIGGGWAFVEPVVQAKSISLNYGSLDVRGKKIITDMFRSDLYTSSRTFLFSNSKLLFKTCYINSTNFQSDYLYSSLTFDQLEITGDPINFDTLKAITKNPLYSSSYVSNANAKTLISNTADEIWVNNCSISYLRVSSQKLALSGSTVGTIESNDLVYVNIGGKLTITNDWIMLDANNCSKRIFWSAGVIEKTSGSLTIYNAILDGVIATGGATFNTVNSFNFNNSSTGFIFNTPVQTYYWIGNNGNWEDHSHWSLSSGGSAAACYPGPSDKIVFDENSFSANGNYTITQTTDSYVGSLDASRLTSNVNFPEVIYASGSVYLSPFFHTKGVFFCSSDNGTNEIYFNGALLEGSLFVQSKYGDWILKDSITCYTFTLRGGGTFNSTGQKINAKNLYVEEGLGNFNGSVIITESLKISNIPYTFDNSKIILPHGGSVDAPLAISEIYSNGELYLQIKSAKKVTANGSLYWYESESIDTLAIREGSQIYMYNYSPTITIEDIVIIPSGAPCGKLTTFNKSIYDPNSITTFNKTSGTLKLKNVSLSNIHATGGATFIAEESIDFANNSGWSFTSIPSKTFYWIGGSGNWDSTSHWSLQSGGLAAGCLPSIQDDVIIDGASFSSPNQSIIRSNTPVQIFNFTVKDIPENTTIALEEVQVSGDLILSKNIKDSRTNFRLIGKGLRSIKANGSVVGTITLEADSIIILDDITVGELTIKTGYIDIRNRVITPYTFNIYSSNLNDSVIVDIRNSTVKTQQFSLSVENTKLLSEHSTIRFLGFAKMLTHSENIILQKIKMDKIEITDPDGIGGQLLLSNLEINSLNIKAYTYDLYIALNNCIIHNFNSDANVNLQFQNLNNNMEKSYIENAQLKNRVTLTTSHYNHIGYLKLEPGTQLSLYADTLRIDQYLDAIGNSTFPITITSLLNNAQSTINIPTGQICCSYLNLSNIKATGAEFYAGPSSNDIYNNSGWNFIDSCEIITIHSSQPLCKGQPFSISTTHPDFVQGFLWSGPQSYYSNSADITINALTDSTQGLYSLLAGGQIRKALIYYEQPPDTSVYLLNSTNGDYILFNTRPSSGEVASINWYKDSVLFDNGNSSGIYVIQNGSYYAEIQTIVGCSYSTNIIDYADGTDTLTLLKIPYQLKAEPFGKNEAILTWMDNNTDATGFSIYRSTEKNGPYTRISYAFGGATSTTDVGLDKGVTYYYKIRALRNDEASAYSDTASVTINQTTADPSGFIIKPVPVLNQLTIESDAPIQQVSIYDQAGAIHFSQDFNSLTSVELDLKYMPQGFYFLKITTDQGQSYKRFVK